ncbi:hypothetical protein PWT90_09528 [Aphanocladium album]|nr:hypothetical protein PWT90_09528 [Aphanocladium album]
MTEVKLTCHEVQVKQATYHDQAIRDKSFDVVVKKAWSLVRQGKEGRQKLMEMAAKATNYASFATALETMSIQQYSKKPRITLKISRLYAGDNDAALTQWLDEWLTGRIKTPQSNIYADLKSLLLASRLGKETIVLVWAITCLALICDAGDIAIPGVFEKRDLPGLLEQAEMFNEYQRQSDLEQLREKEKRFTKALAGVSSLRAACEAAHSRDKGSDEELDYLSDTE